MKRTNIYLTERQCGQLDHRAKVEGVSRAELVRRLLDEGLANGNATVEQDLDALHASFGALADETVAYSRGEDARLRHLEAVGRR
ncbi:MAG: ribbon-helix-helix protein, CopG family [Egibacteraceae bacterium]